MLTLRFFRRDVALFLSLPVTLSLLVLAHAAKTSARQELPAAQAKDEASLLDGFRHVEVASVSDALEQIANKKMYMTHRMRPIFQTRFAGYALTVSLKKDANHDPDALKGMLQAIDTGGGKAILCSSVGDDCPVCRVPILRVCAPSPRSGLAGISSSHHWCPRGDRRARRRR